MKLSYYIDFYNDTYTDSNLTELRIKPSPSFTFISNSKVSEQDMLILKPILDRTVGQVNFLGSIMQVILND